MVLDALVARRVSDLLSELLVVESVIALHGPHSVGKSTVLRALAARTGGYVGHHLTGAAVQEVD